MKRLFHLHIRKTSGTVLYRGIVKSYGKEGVLPYRSDFEILRKLPEIREIEAAISDSTAISGHFYRVARFVPEDFYRVTILRNPLDRAVSAFNHMKNDPNDLLHEQIADLSFPEALQDGRFARELWNGQTRALVSAAGQNFEELQDAERLEVALDYLRSLDCVGFQEKLAPFYDKLHADIGLTVDHARKVNDAVTSNGLKLDDILQYSDQVVFRNRLDLFLYFAAMKFGVF